VGTQYGTFFIDAQMGRVFQFGGGQGGLNEISNAGMTHWFNNNSKLMLRDQFYWLTNNLGTPVELPNRDTADKSVVGFQSVYDPLTDRIILHKKDYRIADENNFYGVEVGVGQIDKGLYYRFADNDYIQFSYWDANALTYIDIDFNNQEYFENLSWTISYALDYNCWVSYHSYMPNFMYSDRSTYYTFINNNDASNRYVWKHNAQGQYQSFYGESYPHIIEMIENAKAVQEKVFYGIQYLSNCYDVCLFFKVAAAAILNVG
jgi:hypothetical protein